MYMTKREKEMEQAQRDGATAFEFRRAMPEEYKDKPHCVKAWEVGYNQAKAEYQDYFDNGYCY